MATINRKSRQYSDINLLFTTSPITADITKKIDEEAIKASIRNLIQTKNFERPFHPEIGSQVHALLFENFTPITAQIMKKTIYDTIEKFEPRATLLDVILQQNVDENSLNVDVIFRINNSERPVTLKTTIQRVR
jgi:phage baseplate assembly protein W